ncbi:MAG: hypothetical protein WAU33_00985 [Candidatus Binataceae bacterium]
MILSITVSFPKIIRSYLFLFYDHPPIPDRIRFALGYAPWSHGGHGEFVP